jgi:hypothetical protein
MARATAFSKCEHTGPFRQADPRRTTARNDGAHERSSSGGPRPAVLVRRSSSGGPVRAALALLQFAWSWNNLLVPLIFLGALASAKPITVQIAGLMQSNGSGESLLVAGTFVAVALPLGTVIGLQRYFARRDLGKRSPRINETVQKERTT